MINKARLDQAISNYVEFLEGRDLADILLWDDCLSNYQDNWNIENLDFLSMFNQSFKSAISTRLWKTDNFYPLEVMKDFIQYEKEIMRSLFRDLLDESKSVDGRIQRFVFYCDQLLEEIRERGKLHPSHYHDNYYMPSLYLSMEHPDKYWFYDIELFRKSLIQLGDLNPPPSHDLNRYYKVTNLFNNLLLNNDLFTGWRDKISNKLKYQGHSRMWAYDLMRFISKEN